MKKFISLFMAFMMVFSCAALAEDAEADQTTSPLKTSIGNQLGFELLRHTYLCEQQALISPTSLTFALSMAAAGAQGETREQILNALDVEELSMDELRALTDSLTVRGVKVANAAFIYENINPKEEYLSSLVNSLDAEIFLFEQMHSVLYEINEWAREKTDGMIDAILDGKPDPSLAMVLINALAMDANWMFPFSTESTSTGIFHSVSSDIETEFMHSTRFLHYIKGDTFQAVNLPYENEALNMLVILPDEGCMYDTLDTLVENGLSLFEGMAQKRVSLALPKVDISASLELAESLQTLGIELPFTTMADFSGMVEGTPLYIGGVTQAVTLTVNESGTRAAAATAISMLAGSAMIADLPIDMTVDRPYIMLVYDQETNSILFAAAISDPTAA